MIQIGILIIVIALLVCRIAYLQTEVKHWRSEYLRSRKEGEETYTAKLKALNNIGK